MLRLLTAAGAFALLATLGSTADAALEKAPLDCSDGGITLTPSDFDSCEGAFIGNDGGGAAFAGEINGLFGTTGTWSQVAKAESSNSWSDGILEILTGLGGDTGTFSVSALPSTAVFVIKASTCYSAYVFGGIGSSSLTGSFDTDKAGLRTGSRGAKCSEDGNVPGISHLSVYTGGSLSAVPLPAAGVLLLGALGGLAAMRRRKIS